MNNFQIIVTCQRCGHKEFIDNPQKYALNDNAQDAGFRLLQYKVPKTSLNKGATVEKRVCGECDLKHSRLLNKQIADRLAFFEEGKED